LRVERPGSVTFGQLIEVGGTDETTVQVRLTSTPEYAALESSLDRVVDELERGEGQTETMKLGSRLKVDRAIVGLVRSSETRVMLDCVVVDFQGKRRLARQKRNFQGEEYGELEREVMRFGNALLAEGEKGKEVVKESTDPLDGRSGLEDWDEEGSGSSGASSGEGDQDRSKERPRTKKKKSNPESESGQGD
ncbi:MAG: hypothetical protein HY901_09000, partial [Deltaproteobacteria bacterium]|nr:hypothetical protein [Deltaproteobacteria bacterium]